MIEEVGIVVGIDDKIAEIEIVRTSACSACKAKAACGHHAIAQVSSKNRMRLFAIDLLASKVGQEVIVGIPENTLLKASLLMYLVPIIGLVVGAIVSSLFTDQPFVAAISTVLGLLIGLGVAKQQSAKYQSNPEFHPRVLAVRQSNLTDVQLIQI